MDKRRPRKREPNLEGSREGSRSEHWGMDPQDVQRHARRMREAHTVSPLGRLFRIAAIVGVLVIALAVYWNFETLRGLRLDFSRVTGALEDAVEEVEDARDGGEPRTEVVGDTSIAGVNMPTSLKGDEEAEAPAGEAPAASAQPEPAAPPAAQTAAPSPAAPDEAAPAAATARAVPEPAPAPPPEPEEPPRPETFGFGLQVMSVSEADASARVLVLRDGGRRAVSFITWWTTDGTAFAGSDFARLEPRTERFGAGEQNRTLLVPIIGDRTIEGVENFYVQFSLGERAGAEPHARIEIQITDDD